MAETRAEAIALLTDRPRFGNGIGLQRMQAVMTGLKPALWSANGRAIHVTGSQGKGTVTTLAAAILSTLGYKTGRLISPHLMRFEERIVMNGVEIGEAALAAGASRFAATEEAYLAVNPNDRFGSGEAWSAVAFEAFTQADIDVAVLEAGIGGRFDATRAAKGSLVALTGIDHEHLSLLGPTAEHVLYDKADLCPAGGLLVSGALMPELKRRLAAYAAIRGFDVLHAEDISAIENIRHERDGALADVMAAGLKLDALKTRVFGLAQLRNAVIALLIVRAWLERKGAMVPDGVLGEAARQALGETSVPLRFERIADKPVVIADVAHTAQATQALASTLSMVYPNERFVFLTGISDDRPAGEILEPLRPLASTIICTQGHRGHAAALIAAVLPQRSGLRVLAIDRPEAAYAEAIATAMQDGQTLIVTGSLFLAAAAKCIAAGGDPAAMEFL